MEMIQDLETVIEIVIKSAQATLWKGLVFDT